MTSNQYVTLVMLRDIVSELTKERISTMQQAFVPAKQPLFQSNRSSLSLQLTPSIPSENSTEVAKLQSALATISSDVPRGDGSMFTGPTGNPNGSYWLGVVWAVASLGWISGKQVVREWSQKSMRYTDSGFEKAWSDFNPNHPNPVGVGSIYKLAQSFVHTTSSAKNAPVEELLPSGKYALLSAADVMRLPAPTWRVKRLLPDKGLAAIYGPSTSGKSFLAFDLGACIAEGQLWFGHQAIAAPVVYVMLEGEAGVKKRLMAWEKSRGRSLPAIFSTVLQSVHLTDEHDVLSLADVVPKGAVIFIDTLNRAAPTADENSSKDMGAIIEGANVLRQLTDGLVVLVHHTGKDTTQGMRGHSSLFAALDGAIEVRRNSTGRTWTVAKTKDGEDGKATPFQLVVHDVGIDTDGEFITSCTVEAANSAIFVKALPSHAGPKNALKAIADLIATGVGLMAGINGAPVQVRCIKVDDAVTAVAATLVAVKSNKRTYTARRRIESLTNSGHLGGSIDKTGDSWCWIEP